MKKLFLLLILSFISTTGYSESPAPAPDQLAAAASTFLPAPSAPSTASIASKAEAVRIAEEKSRAESEASPDAPTAASIAAKAEAVRIAEEMSAAESESAREEMSAAEAEALRIDTHQTNFGLWLSSN